MNSTHDQVFQLNFLFQTAAEGILLADADGYLRRLNPAAAAMLGLSPETAPGQHTSVLFKHRPGLIRLLNAPGEQQAMITLLHKRIATGVGMDRPGGGRIVLLHDVTEREAIESRREALERQVEHDLRNSLNALLGYADLVAKFGDLTPEQTKFQGRVRLVAQKLYELAGTLVDLAWIEAGMALKHSPVELAHLIREVIEELEPEAHDRNVALVFSLQDPVPSVIGDPRRLKQMITYLLENGVRYSVPDSNVAIHLWQEGAKIFCSVGDQGIGIQPDEIDNIWDRLWRSSDERVQAVHGGGIGLTFARAIVLRHGGRIWVESEPEEGTTVTFMLPLAEGW